MNAEQKQRAAELLAEWRATAYALHGDRMADQLQELVGAPEAEPFAVIHLDGSFVHVEFKQPIAGTGKFEVYAAPPVPSVPDGWRSLTDVEWMNIVNFDRAYSSYDKEEAVNEAVKRTEAKLKELNAAPTPAEAPADVARDAARLDWLDERNAPHGLGWEIIQMPAGNVHIHTLFGDKAKFGSIRDAIDAAIERQGGES